jgi:Zn-dependent protease
VASRGYLQVARFGSAPVLLHWTLPLGPLVFSLGGHFTPGAILGFALVVLIHELGHARVVRRCGLRVVSIEAHGLGGVCRYAGDASPIARARIAWGGVNAQLAAFGVAVLALWLLGDPMAGFASELTFAFTSMNLAIVAFNLLPLGNLDGVEAWKLPGLLRARARARAAAVARTAAKANEADARRSAARTLALVEDGDRRVPAETAAAVDVRLRELAGGKDPSGKS